MKIEPYRTTRPASGAPHGSTTQELPMNHEPGCYVVSIEAQPFRRKTRYYWTICGEHAPEVLVSWGHAESQQLAETEAGNEIRDLLSGLTQGGRVAAATHCFNHRW
jgi:uncharacterized protein YceH (UPF0502 family)